MPRHFTRLGFVVLTTLLASCGGSQVAAPPVTPSPGSTATAPSDTTTTESQTPCAFAADTVDSAADLVQLQVRGATQVGGVPPGSKPPLKCGTVRAVGGGTANVVFAPRVANCQFTKDPASTKIATLHTRQPDGTLVELTNGQITCTTAKPGQLLSLCGLGDIQPDGTVNQLVATCNVDPTFTVTIIGGSATVTNPSGKRFEMGAGQTYDYNFDNPASTKVTGATLTRSQTAVFVAQARALDVSFAPPTTTTTLPIIR